MSANFDFLRNFDNDLHYLACIIEGEVYDSPSAVLTDATTFLEIIAYELFRKNEIEMEELVYFKDKVSCLYSKDLISPELRKYMLKAYSIRNKMHSYNGDVKNHIHLNQMRAVHLHKLLFKVSWLYYIENSPDHFKLDKPSYVHPSRLKNDMLTRSEIGNGKCIICEETTKSEDELFCSKCKYKIEKSDNLKTLRKHFGFKKGFRRNELVEMGFEKGYIGPFLQELKNDDLINSVGKLNYIDRENTDRYISEAEAMICVEKILSDFKLKNITLTDIIANELYQKGAEMQYPYVGLYHLFSKVLHCEFITQINKGTEISEILESSYLTMDELDEWYFKKDSQEHQIFTEKLIDEIFQNRRKGEEKTFKISDEILDDIAKSETYLKKEDELKFSAFLKRTFADKTGKTDALNQTGLSEGELDDILSKYPELEEKFERDYTGRKMEKFLKHYDYYNYDYSLKKNGLIQKEIEEWLDRAVNKEGELYVNFLNDYRKMTVEKYVQYRKDGSTRYRALKRTYSTEGDIEELLNAYDNDLEEHLIYKSIELLQSGKTRDEAIKILDVTPEWFAKSIERGMNGEDIYVGLYHAYSSNSIPGQIAEFMEMIKTRPLKNVLKELNMDEREMESWYEQGKNSIPPYDEFYTQFLEYKKESYIRTMIKTDSTKKALKKSYLTDDEFRTLKGELEREISERSLSIVIDELKKGNTTKTACNKASVKMETLYDWIRQAQNGNEDYADFLEVYKEEYLTPIRRAYADGVKQGVNEKRIIRTMKKHKFLVNDDVKHLRHLDMFPKPGDEVIELDEELEIEWE